jgi:hypothetical protein
MSPDTCALTLPREEDCIGKKTGYHDERASDEDQSKVEEEPQRSVKPSSRAFWKSSH